MPLLNITFAKALEIERFGIVTNEPPMRRTVIAFFDGWYIVRVPLQGAEVWVCATFIDGWFNEETALHPGLRVRQLNGRVPRIILKFSYASQMRNCSGK